MSNSVAGDALGLTRPVAVTAGPGATPWTAAVRETHTGCVVLLGDMAYKMKKPVRTGFLDFGTAEARHAALLREWQLNARFSPDAYVGIAYLADAAAGTPEPLLQMRRQDDAHRLSTLARSGADLAPQMQAIATLLADAHKRTPRPSNPDATGSAEALRARWHRNVAEAYAGPSTVIDPEVLDSITSLADTYLAGRGALFSARIAAGRIVDGHGDLIAQDIFCGSDGVTILDCLDFDDSLRHVDALDDACFLAMDLEHHGRPDLAEEFLAAFTAATGDREAPPSLRHHFMAYRAFVRAEVATIRVGQGDRSAATLATDHAEQCLDHLRAGQVRVVVVGGLPGSGKSTVAEGIGDRRDCLVLSSDVIRKQLVGLDPLHSARSAFATGLYSPEMTERTYDVLLRRAHIALDHGRSVVLDATWRNTAARVRARHLAAETDAVLTEIECVAPESMSSVRMTTRPPTASDADREVYAAMARNWPRWESAAMVDTSGLPEDAIGHALSVLDRAPTVHTTSEKGLR